MLENLPGDFNTARQMAELLDPLPELGLHLDIGHANLLVVQSSVGELLEAYGSRLRHVHLHDNKGGSADLHLPLGTGTVDLRLAVRLLQRPRLRRDYHAGGIHAGSASPGLQPGSATAHLDRGEYG